MQDHKPRLRSLRRPTPGWIDVLIALCAGATLGIIFALNF